MTIRERVRQAIPGGAFLRRDRGDGLYITNAPAKGGLGLLEGFSVCEEGGIARISIAEDAFEEIAEEFVRGGDVSCGECLSGCGSSGDDVSGDGASGGGFSGTGFCMDGLSRELSRFTGASCGAVRIFQEIIKAIENPAGADVERLDRNLRQAAAAALRAGGGEGLYHCARAMCVLRRTAEKG